MLADGLPMRFGGVSLVLIPSVLGKMPALVPHVFVPARFSQDGGGGYAGIDAISFHNAMERNLLEGLKPVSVD